MSVPKPIVPLAIALGHETVVEPSALLRYLDNAIEKWRIHRDTPPQTYVTAGLLVSEQLEELEEAEYMQKIAPIYVDAFQSVRASVFGETKS